LASFTVSHRKERQRVDFLNRDVLLQRFGFGFCDTAALASAITGLRAPDFQASLQGFLP
jgi:hypothetical protein